MKPKNNSCSLVSVDWNSVLGSDCLGLDSVELQQLQQQLLNHSPRSVRLSCRRTADELPFALVAIPWYSRLGFWVADPAVRPGAYLNYAGGDYYIQDAASMLALALCDVQPGQLVCDLCSAPGGKATGLLDQLQGRGLLVANEVIQSRLGLLQLALCRSGWCNHTLTNLDVDELAGHLPGHFDCVLVDAPCSGQSMVGRDRQSVSAFSQTQIELNAARQARIIAGAARLVKPQGKLVYSTCTFSVAENEAVIEQFLEDHPHWRLAPNDNLRQWSSPQLNGSYRVWPHRDHCDGGFAVALVCEHAATDQSTTVRHRKQRWQHWHGSWDDLGFLTQVASAGNHRLYQQQDLLHLFNAASELTPLAFSGVPIAEIQANLLKPHYGSAVTELKNANPTKSVMLDNHQAVRFVRGESIPAVELDPRSLSVDTAAMSQLNAWCQVCWNGRPLSWGKLAGGTLKNHLPKMLRNSGVQA
jgi:16S rRNA C967 or C1407 C5-methylase (RsmB/RsmF family)/NOL1/NOP2/fmu family ribosome biogenesis protein